MVLRARRERAVERTTENGVEVIINHFEPYGISGESAGLKIEKEFIIDTEHRALAALGLIDIRAFGQLGQGPGEVRFPLYQGINSSDQILIWDSGALKLLVFDSRGDLRTETRLGMNVPA